MTSMITGRLPVQPLKQKSYDMYDAWVVHPCLILYPDPVFVKLKLTTHYICTIHRSSNVQNRVFRFDRT